MQTHIGLCGVHGQTSEHDGLALFLIGRIASVIVFGVISIGVMTVIGPIAAATFPPSLLHGTGRELVCQNLRYPQNA